MKATTRALGAIAAVSLGLVVAGCSSSSSPSSSPSAASSSAVTVTSLTVVCPKLEAALKALPTGSVGNEQISAFIKTLNQYKAEVPPAQQAPINGMIEAYQALLDANTQAASDEAQQKVVAAATELTMACAAATQSPG